MSFKLSDGTLRLMKNFADINPGQVFTPGKVLQVLEPQRRILGKASIEDDFPDEFAISDVGRFLGVLGLHDKEVILDLEPGIVKIQSKSGKVTRYRLTDKANVVHPDKPFNFPGADAMLILTTENVENILADSASLGLPHIVFTGDTVILLDAKDDSRDTHTIPLQASSNTAFRATFKVETLGKLMRGTEYKMELSAKKVAHFSGKNIDYFMAIENWS
jgi:hypothetical protein